ncbi:MAG: CbtA family protein [Woeseiaceae bacterium]
MLRMILISAFIVGAISGVFLTALQQYNVTPLILEAEIYESSANGHAHEQSASAHSHTNTQEKDDTTQRLYLSLLSNIFAAIGFALITVAAITFSNQAGWKKGLLWGAAGFIVFYIAPSLGLPPKLPGTSGAPLLHQQLWWGATVSATAAGIAMLVFSSKLSFKGVGLLLLIIPHLVGAPVPEQFISSAPDSLLQQFVIASGLTNAFFWLILGTLSGYFLYKLDDRALE